MATDHIRYDLLAQDALRGMIRRVMDDVARAGLPGEHYFYISFNTMGPGVRLSQRMREKYPGEMTIVLQHQFWDLTVNEQGFDVGLSFGGVPEKLVIPFEAITAFHDPSVDFGLKFETIDGEASAEAGAAPPLPQAGNTVAPPPPARIGSARPKPAAKDGPRKPVAARDDRPKASDKKGAGGKPAAPPAEATPETGASAEIVSLDTFRKK